MKNRMFWLIALVWLAMVFFVFPTLFKPQTVPASEVMLEQAQAKEKAAGDDEKELNKAVKAYQAVAKVKQYKKTNHAAEARLRVGIIYETKLKNERGAVQAYTDLVRDFDPQESESAREAEERLARLQEQINNRHLGETGYKFIDALVGITGRHPKYSHAFALFIIALAVKLLTTPLSRLQFKYMKEMQKIQPLVKQLQEKFKGNQQELGRKTMELYKEHGVNPFSSCLPLLVQMPVLILLYYKVILAYQFQFAKGEFLWIGSSLAQRFPSLVAENLSQPDIPLLLVYTVSMIISQKLTIVDPTQAEQQKIMAYMMPIMFAFLFKSFPSALMLYWLFFNIISTTQQYLIMRQPAAPGGPAAPALPTGEGPAVPPVETPRRPPTRPGKKGKRRRRRFEALKLPRPAWQPIPSG